MSTVGPARPGKKEPGYFTDTRTVVIVLVALALSLGGALGAYAVSAEAGLGATASLVATLSAGGASFVLMVSSLHRLIGR